jgi:hypothetical protein
MKTPKITVFKNGDIVVFKREFLRNISLYVDVPLNGKVVNDSDPDFPVILWCDRDITQLVNARNLILESEKYLELV